jgi:hypothetical protein
LTFEVNSINGIPIIPVVEDRMRTAYVFHSDPSAQAKGYAPAPASQIINWLVMPRSVPIAISKTDNLKIWTPETNILGDDWLLQYRKYHDLWVMQHQLNQIVLSVRSA